ncbi:MAG: serine/threonine-protein phosphatase, partial [Lentisphaeria bacterium]|nr:serine/threonine-protein phosphatase [Lentisphaeria bacterium]
NRSDRKTYTKYIGVPMPDGKAFLQLGYTWKRFEEQFETFFFPLLADAEFGGMGYFLIAGPDGRVKVPVNGYPGAIGRTLAELGFRSRDLKENQNVPFYARINEAWCKCIRYENIGKWKIYAVQPLAEYYSPAVQTVIVAGLLLFALCIIFRLLILKFRSAQRKIDALREAEAKRQEEDLALARRIQLSQLREGVCETAVYRVYAVMTPARMVGGDFYDYFELPDGRLAVAIADVSGKGIPAAFFMMHAKAIIKSSLFRCASPAEAAGMANQRLNHNNDAYMFVTAWIGIYDPQTGVLEYVSAGHNPALIKRADGSAEWVEHPRAMALGAFPQAKYTGKTAGLRPGDTLILYTDGVTEAMDPAGSLYGADRLMSCVSQAVPPVIPAVEADLKKYIDGAAQTDDITMLTLERRKI